MDTTLSTDAELLRFFKALADESRLKIVGQLARGTQSGQQLADQLGLKPKALAHHLARLAEAGLISTTVEGQAQRYELRLGAIHALAARVSAQVSPPALADDLEAYDRQVLTAFLRPDGSLKEIPAQEKKLLAVLRYLRDQFEPGRKYPEKEVNGLLARWHPDTASLRRMLIDYRLMKRERGVYWREPMLAL